MLIIKKGMRTIFIERGEDPVKRSTPKWDESFTRFEESVIIRDYATMQLVAVFLKGVIKGEMLELAKGFEVFKRKTKRRTITGSDEKVYTSTVGHVFPIYRPPGVLSLATRQDLDFFHTGVPKLIHHIEPREAQAPQYKATSSEQPILLFHLEDDPLEQHNLAERHPQIVADLARSVDRWIAQKWWLFKNVVVDDRERDRLIALGYISPGDERKSRVPTFGEEVERLGVRRFWNAAVSSEVGVSPTQKERIDAIAQRATARLRDMEGQPIERLVVHQEMGLQVREVLDEGQRAALSAALRSASSAAGSGAVQEGP